MAMQSESAGPQTYIDQLAHQRRGLRVLDAGCGGRLSFDLPPDATLTGIDISEESARRNKRITQIIIGDLQYHPLPAKSFDVVICCDVLEHLPRPELALASLFNATKDDGIVILELPNVLSLKGLVTKFTPHFFHVWILRTFLNFENAGKPGFAPFPTFLRRSIAPDALLRLCAAHRMKPVHFLLYEGSTIAQLRRKSPPSFMLYALLVKLLNGFFLGRRDFGLSDMQLVLRHDTAGAAAPETLSLASRT
jgi:2-polyprenyl-3-methyl-5-hydroxy-6-metoxy-1,4-benzoquinol methylase